MTPNDNPARGEPNLPRHGFDPDLDSPHHGRRAVPIPREYQRIVANPFLALFSGLAGAALFSHLVSAQDVFQRTPFVGLVGIVTVAACTRLLQYHCLDCGHTGWLFRWRLHACNRVVERKRSRRGRPFPGPKPTTQTVLWTFLMLCAALVLAIAGL